jgi:hypothetical protein
MAKHGGATLEADAPQADAQTPETEQKPQETAETNGTAKAKKAKRPFVLTPFQCKNRLNDMLVKAGLADAETGEGLLQGPMLYQYAAQGRFKTHPAQVDVEAGVTKPRLEADEASFMDFAKKYIAAKASGTRSKAEEPEGADAGETQADPRTADEWQLDEATKAAMQESEDVASDDESDELEELEEAE